jgi:hypothetical protein
MYGNSNLDSGADLAKEQKNAAVPWMFRIRDGGSFATNSR